jgi:hypothetical protein
MKKRYLLPFRQTACFLLISLLLQNCGGSGNLPLEREQELKETIEQKEGQLTTIGKEEQQENTPIPTIMPELWQEVFSYLDFEGVLAARSVNADWNKLITGFREAGIVGVENKPSHIIDTHKWVKIKEIDFTSNKLEGLTPITIPSFAFYYLMGKISNLPQSFWTHLQETQVHTLDLSGNWIVAAGALELAKALPATQVHTLDLYSNQIGAEGAQELAKALPATRVHTLDLGSNQIGAVGAKELAKALPGTQLQTLNLYHNQIGDEGASELAKALIGTQVHTLNLSWNRIGDAGASELAKVLSATRVHTLSLGANQIGAAIQQLLKEQYPHINCMF